MFDLKHLYQSSQSVHWNVPADQAIQLNHASISEFIDGFAVPGLASKTFINVGGTLFGRAVIRATQTAMKDSSMYAVSLGLAYGKKSVLLVTLRCMEGDFLQPPGMAAYDAAKQSSRGTVKKMLDLDFMDATMGQLHDFAVEKVESTGK